MRKYTVPVSATLEFILGDHLGSTSITTNASGVKTSELRYKPWGEVRYSWTKDLSPGLPTNYTFTGQYSYMDDPTTAGVTEGFGLMFYNARWVDVQLGRFTQADSIIPESQGTQAWDRFAYVNNSPVKYNDPTGHMCSDPEDPTPGCDGGMGTGSNGNPKPKMFPGPSFREPSRYPITKAVILGSFYIPPAGFEKIEDDGKPAEDKIAALVNGIALFVQLFPSAEIVPNDNVFVSMMYEVSGVGIDPISIIIDNGSDTLVSLTYAEISADLPNASSLVHRSVPDGFALAQSQPGGSSTFSVCSICLDNTNPKANTNLLPNNNVLIVQVYVAWFRRGVRGINIMPLVGSATP